MHTDPKKTSVSKIHLFFKTLFFTSNQQFLSDFLGIFEIKDFLTKNQNLQQCARSNTTTWQRECLGYPTIAPLLTSFVSFLI